MSDCCLTNLGCLQIPTTVIGSQGQAGANGSVWRTGSGAPSNALGVNGDFYINSVNSDVYVKAAGVYTIALNIEGATGSQGGPGFARVAYSLADVLSGLGGTSTPKIFITQPVNAVDMPQTQGSSLVLTFNIRNEFNGTFLSTLQYIGVDFGGVSCINGSYLSSAIIISKVLFFEAQVKIEVIRGVNSTVGYSRVSFIGADPNGVTLTYTESNPLTGLNFGVLNNFEIRGKQVFENGFRFSTLTVDKIIAQ
jgi:hypothetical protein